MADFLCGRCSQLMCEDCPSVADEYVTLYQNHRLAAMSAQDEADKLRQENEQLKRQMAMYKELAQTSLPEVVAGWLSSINIEAALERVKKAQEHDRELAEFNALMRDGKTDEALAIAQRWVS